MAESPLTPARRGNDLSHMMIRPARISDIDELEELEFDCFDDDVAFSRRQWRHLLTRANALTLVIESADRQAPSGQYLWGYAMLLLRRNSSKARLYSLCVEPRVQRQGLARRLLGNAENAAIARGCSSAMLEVRADNRAALALYRRLGWLPQGWIDNYYSDGCAAWRMIKPLSSR
ncbi:Mycothiol acetyltransferase [Carnimonas sp. R-84981]|uniref:GNAT family N-acetyltransferase n=1 Tax=Carnimonas bestiolae TaxID=3402172 RepID=UPI003EDBFF40